MGKISNKSKPMVNLNASDLYVYSVIDKLISAKKNECSNEGITFLGLIQLSENHMGYITPLLCKDLFEKQDDSGINLRRCDSTLCLIRKVCSKTFVSVPPETGPIAENPRGDGPVKLEKSAAIKDNKDVETSLSSNKTLKDALRGQLTSGIAPTDLRSAIYNRGVGSVPIYKKKEKIIEENKEWKLFQMGTQRKAGPAKPETTKHGTLSVIFSRGSSLESNGSLLTTKRQPSQSPEFIKSFTISRSLLNVPNNVNSNDLAENVVSRVNGDNHFPTYEKKTTASSLLSSQTNENFTCGAKFTTIPRPNLPDFELSTSNASSYCDNWSNSGRSHDSISTTSNETYTFTPFEHYLVSNQTLIGNSCSSQSFNLDRENQKIYNKLENLVCEMRQMFVYRQDRECCYPPLSYLCRRKRRSNNVAGGSPQNAKQQKPTSSNKTLRIEETDSVIYVNVPVRSLPSTFLLISSDEECKEGSCNQFGSVYKLVVETPNVSEKSRKAKSNTCKNHSKCNVVAAPIESSSQPPQDSQKKPSKIPLKKKCTFQCVSSESKVSPIQDVASTKNKSIGTSTCNLPPFNTFCCFRHTNRPNCKCCNNCINYPRPCGTCLGFTPKRASTVKSVPQPTVYIYNEKTKNTRSSLPRSDLNENPSLIVDNETPMEIIAQTAEKNKVDSCTNSTQTFSATLNETGSNTQSNALGINERESVRSSATKKVIFWEDPGCRCKTDEIETVNFKDAPGQTLKEFRSSEPKSDLEKNQWHAKEEETKTDDSSNVKRGLWENQVQESESTTHLNIDPVNFSTEKQTSPTQEADIRDSNNEPSNLKEVSRETLRDLNSNDAETSLNDVSRPGLRESPPAKSNVNAESLESESTTGDYFHKESPNVSRDFQSSVLSKNVNRGSLDNQESEVNEADCSNNSETNLKDVSREALSDFRSSIVKNNVNRGSWENQAPENITTAVGEPVNVKDASDNRENEAKEVDCSNDTETSFKDASTQSLRNLRSSNAQIKINRGSVKNQINEAQENDTATSTYSNNEPSNLKGVSPQMLRDFRSSIRTSNVGQNPWNNRENEAKEVDCSNDTETSLKDASTQSLRNLRSSNAQTKINRGSVKKQINEAQENDTETSTYSNNEPSNLKGVSPQMLRDFRSSIRTSNVGQNSWDNRENEAKEVDCSNDTETSLKDASKESLKNLRSSITKSKINRGSVKKQINGAQENDTETIDYSNNVPINLKDASGQSLRLTIRTEIRKNNVGRDSWDNREREAKKTDSPNDAKTSLKGVSRQRGNRSSMERQTSETQKDDGSNDTNRSLKNASESIRFSIRKSNVERNSSLRDLRSSNAKSNVNQDSWENQAQENVTTAMDEPVKDVPINQELLDKNPRDPNESESKTYEESLPEEHTETNNRSEKEPIHLKEVSGLTSIPSPSNLSGETEELLAVAASPTSTSMPNPKVSTSLDSWKKGTLKIVSNGPSKSQSLIDVHIDRELKDWLPSDTVDAIKSWLKIDNFTDDDVVKDLMRKMDELEQAYDFLLRAPEKRAKPKQSDSSKKRENCGGCSTSCNSGHNKKEKRDQVSKQKEKIMKDVTRGVEVVLNSVKEFKKLINDTDRSKEM